MYYELGGQKTHEKKTNVPYYDVVHDIATNSYILWR